MADHGRPYQAMAEPAAKRAAAAAQACSQLKRYLESRPSDETHQVGWTILAQSVAHALDYDFRMCPSEALLAASAQLRTSCAEVLTELAGGLVAEVWFIGAQLQTRQRHPAR